MIVLFIFTIIDFMETNTQNQIDQIKRAIYIIVQRQALLERLCGKYLPSLDAADRQQLAKEAPDTQALAAILHSISQVDG
jgi:hypothetical protein